MRQLVAIAVIGVLGALAILQTPPPDQSGPALGFAPTVDPGGAVGDESAWYCPWVASGAVRDSTYDVASAVNVQGSITLPNANPTLEADLLSFELQGADARSVDTAEIVRRGPAPGIVEFDDGPAVATTAMWTDAILTGDQCVASVPKVWHLVGGITAEGFTLELRLFNPFPEAAKVTVQTVSEFGASPLGGFEGLDVPGRSWVTEDLSRAIPFLDNVTLIVSAQTGLVIPALVLNTAEDEATWNGIRESTTWDFPVTSVAGLEPTLVLSNTGSVGAMVTIDIFGFDGATLEATTLLVSPLQPTRVHLADFADPPFAVRVTSNAPLGAVIQAGPPGTFPRAEVENGDDHRDDSGDQPVDGEEPAEPPLTYVGLASTTGNVDPATRWILPGIGVVPAAQTSVWIMNPSGDPATVTITPLGAQAGGPEKFIIASGSLLEVSFGENSETGVNGVLIVSTVPVSAAVSVAGTRGVAFIGGIPVE